MIATSFGTLAYEELSPAKGEEPTVVLVNGSFPPKGYLSDFRVPGAGVTLFALPAMWSPPFKTYSIDVFGRAIGEAVEALFPTSTVIMAGFSTGATVALGVNAPRVRAWVAVEPFLSTEGLWPIQKFMDAQRQNLHPEHVRYAEEALGVFADRIEQRPVPIRAGRPLHVVAGTYIGGDEALQWPSLTTLADRIDLERRGAKIWLARGGHAVLEEDKQVVMRAFAAVLDEVRTPVP